MGVLPLDDSDFLVADKIQTIWIYSKTHQNI